MVAPRRVQHDFSGGAVAMLSASLDIYHELPVALDVRWGTSYDGAAAAAAAAGSPRSPGALPPAGTAREASVAASAPAQEGGPPFAWCGQTMGALAGVAGGAAVTVPLRAALLQPGWVALTGCWVAWSCKEAPHLSGAMAVTAPHLVVIQC